MGRVNLEERLFSEARIGVLARALGYPVHCAIGLVAYLWHDSQEIGSSQATAQDIADWCRLDEFRDFEFQVGRPAPIDIDGLIAALIRSRFIEETGPGLYLIRGNQKHVDNLIALKENAVKGGEVRAKTALRESGRFAATPAARLEAHQPPPSEPPAQFNTIQDNAIQISSIQISSIQNKTLQKEGNGIVAAAKAAAPPLLPIWNDNCGILPKAHAISGKRKAAWQSRWGSNPDPQYWSGVVRRLSASSFCQGNNDKGWKACIDFFLKPDTHLKAMEGKYDNSGAGGRHRTREESVSAANQALWERVERGEA